jgi:hypothetical protein
VKIRVLRAFCYGKCGIYYGNMGFYSENRVLRPFCYEKCGF